MKRGSSEFKSVSTSTRYLKYLGSWGGYFKECVLNLAYCEDLT